jgi:hypothetical protein
LGFRVGSRVRDSGFAKQNCVRHPVDVSEIFVRRRSIEIDRTL